MSYEDINGIVSSKRFAYIAIRELLVGRKTEIKDFIKRIANAKSEAEISRVMYAVRKAL